MIKAVIGNDDGERCLVLGVDAENVRRMKLGGPIFVRGAELEGAWPNELAVAVVYGERLQDIVDELREAGLNVPETVDEEVR